MKRWRAASGPRGQWERYGELDPYYAVLTAPEYRRERLDADRRRQFFTTGRRQLDKLAEAVEAFTGSALQGGTAVDFGCGVGRLTLPLAERCDHVYGVDVSSSMLREAERNAAEQHVTNVEWLPTDSLGELAGRYDLVLSLIVFQHIPTREGERLFASLASGLRPGGVAAIGVTVAPGHPLGRLLRWARKTLPGAAIAANLLRGSTWSRPHMEVHAYSLGRLGALLAEQGITDWHVRFRRARDSTRGWRNLDTATIVFRKPVGPITAPAPGRRGSPRSS